MKKAFQFEQVSSARAGRSLIDSSVVISLLLLFGQRIIGGSDPALSN
jgi:hypothetical protein